MKVTVYNLQGKEEGTLDFNKWDVTLSKAMLAQVIRAYITNAHQGTKKAKDRGEIRHPDKKPWRQKGTGRARAGSRNSPIWVGGGVTHGPKPHQTRKTIPAALKAKALMYMLEQELAQNNVIVLKQDNKELKTKDAANWIDAVGYTHNKVTFVLPNKDETVAKAFRNLKNVKIRRAELLNPFDLYRNAKIVVSEAAWDNLINRLSKYATR